MTGLLAALSAEDRQLVKSLGQDRLTFIAPFVHWDVVAVGGDPADPRSLAAGWSRFCHSARCMTH